MALHLLHLDFDGTEGFGENLALLHGCLDRVRGSGTGLESRTGFVAGRGKLGVQRQAQVHLGLGRLRHSHCIVNMHTSAAGPVTNSDYVYDCLATFTLNNIWRYCIPTLTS